MLDFSCIKNTWTSAKPMDFKKATPDPGVYECSVDRVTFGTKETKFGDRACVTWSFSALDEHKCTMFEFEHLAWLSDEKSCARFKGTMQLLGLNIPDDPCYLDQAFAPIIGAIVRVEVKQQGEYTNVYIRRLISKESTVEQDLSVFDKPIDDIPY